jgi:AI-2 transport protein TqsA
LPGLVERTGKRIDLGLRVSVGLGSAVAILAGIYFAAPVIAPLTFALLIIALIWPVQERLQKRVSKLAALFVSITVTIAVVTGFASLVTLSAERVGRYIVGNASRFQGIYEEFAGWLEHHGVVVANVWAEHFNVTWLLHLFREITIRMNYTLTFSIVMLTYIILGLLELDEFARKLRALQRGDVGRMLLVGGANAAVKFRRYMLVRTLMSIATGLLVWGFASAVGLELAVEWGIIAFVLNYVPYIGPLVATIVPTLAAIGQYGSWEMSVLVFTCLTLIQFLLGNYLEPRIAGHALAVSPFLLLFAVFFWTFLWGIAGAFIGVPITIAALTFCEQHPSWRWIADLASSSPATTTSDKNREVSSD